MNKVLVIDDDPMCLRLMSAMLTHLGHDVHTSLRGNQGVDMAIEINPDVVMIDLLMPKPTYDGVQVAEILRSMAQFIYTPLVIISAADIQTMQKLLTNGMFNDFLQKPITYEAVATIFPRLSQCYTA